MTKEQTQEQQLETIMEVVRIKQILKENEYGLKLKKVCSPQDAAEVVYEFIADEDREVFLVLCLNVRNQIISVHRCHVGDLSSAPANPREIFKTAILSNSYGIIIAHNHPSSNTASPSSEDIHASERIQKAGEILGIQLLDSIIVTPSRTYCSLMEKGYIF